MFDAGGIRIGYMLGLASMLVTEQVVDVLMITSTSFSMVDGDVVWPSTNFPSCTLMCSYQSVGVKRHHC